MPVSGVDIVLDVLGPDIKDANNEEGVKRNWGGVVRWLKAAGEKDKILNYQIKSNVCCTHALTALMHGLS